MKKDLEYENIKELVRQLKVEEKAGWCYGKDFWHLQEKKEAGLQSMMVTDGPHGLRKQPKGADHLGIQKSNTAICFPAGCAMASSFDKESVRLMGENLGQLARYEDIGILLGPAINIKRSPLCGRNFEYFSEDPIVAGELATAYINGVQSQGVGTCPKHFLANNQEYYRNTSNSVVDEQALREIYLVPFEKAVMIGKPWSIMCSYNRINGIYASENRKFLTDILRNEWNFEGFTMTDWGALNDPIEAIRAGMDLGMPGPNQAAVDMIIQKLNEGKLNEEQLNTAVERIIHVVSQFQKLQKKYFQKEEKFDFDNGHALAVDLACQCAILLKNEDKVLPLGREERILLVGEFATTPRYQGGGSSHIHPYRVSSAWEILKDNPSVSFVKGYSGTGDASQKQRLLHEAVEAAGKADKVVIFVGLPESYENEGMDRKHMRMPSEQNELIKEVCRVQKNTIIVLHNGAPVEMPWAEDVSAILEMYLAGEGIGEATVRLLYGEVNPSGRLAETFPVRLEDNPTWPYYGIEKKNVVYREGILVGYRHYLSKRIPVRFPFGYGLSYTTFEYSDLNVERKQFHSGETLKVSVTVKNTGTMEGKEVVALYVSLKNPDVIRPERELKAFEKVFLQPGKRTTVYFELNERDFSTWDSCQHNWIMNSGNAKIQICRNAEEVILERNIQLQCAQVCKFDINTPVGEIIENAGAAMRLKQAVEMAVEKKCPGIELIQGILNGLEKHGKDAYQTSGGTMSEEALQETLKAMPLRAMVSFGSGLRYADIEKIIDYVNKRE